MLFPDTLPTMHELRATGHTPRVHGNGFIQLDLTPKLRMHVWGDPRIPRQRIATPIHDHVFGFTSMCYRGRVVNIPYSLVSAEAGDYDVYVCVPAEGHDTKLVRAEGLPVFARPCCPDVVTGNGHAVGSRMYSFCAGSFHETFAPDGTAVTIIQKHGLTVHDDPAMERRPRVLVPVGTRPDNEFDRHAFDPEQLWAIIADAVAP